MRAADDGSSDGAEVRDMAYQITLTDDEYQRLSAAAAQQGKTIEELVRAALDESYAPWPEPSRHVDPLAAHMYRNGHLLELPMGEPDTPEEEAELDEIAGRILPGKMASDIVIEDRGPR
jgi:plasmid stability protein